MVKQMTQYEKFSSDHLDALQAGLKYVPHAVAIGLKVLDIKPSGCRMSIPYDKNFIGNVENGVIHGGIITTLLDTTCGLAVQLTLEETTSIATLDLRIDYMKPATPGLGLIAHATCFKATRNIAFVRGTAYHLDEADPIATSVGTFMIGSNRIPPEKFSELMKDVPENIALLSR